MSLSRHRLMVLNIPFFHTGILWYMCFFFPFVIFFLLQFFLFFIVSWIVYTCCVSLNVKFHERRKIPEACSNSLSHQYTVPVRLTSPKCIHYLLLSSSHILYLQTLWLFFVPSGVEHTQHTQLCKSHSIFKDAFCVYSIATSVFCALFSI